MAFDRIPGYNPANTVGSRLPTAEQDEIRAVSDYLGKPRVLHWTGTAWPERPDDAVTTLFIGGAAPDDAPSSLVAGDIWMPASEPGGGVVTGLSADGAPTLGGNLNLNGYSVGGVSPDVLTALGTRGLRFFGDYSGSDDYMVNDVVRYVDPSPSSTADLTGLYACLVDHTSGSPKVQPGR